jgi:hypothetical protein
MIHINVAAHPSSGPKAALDLELMIRSSVRLQRSPARLSRDADVTRDGAA